MADVLKIVNWLRVKNSSDLKLSDSTEELTQMKVMKLLYYIQGTSLVYLGSRMFDNDIVAWKYGPAVEAVHAKYKGQREIVGQVTRSDLDDYAELSNNEKYAEVLNAVYDNFGEKSAIDLMNMTHQESPWKNTEQSNIITDDKMIAFFKKIVVTE